MIGDVKSGYSDINCGVPQGSILGPTLFLIYINNLAFVTRILDPILYADDTNLFYESKNLNEEIEVINSELKLVENWCSRNKPTVNMDKTNFIIIKSYQNRFQLNKKLKLFGNDLNETESIKFLGVYIDKNLTWESDINHVNKQMRSMSSLMVKSSEFLPRHVLKLIYNAFINSKISYCLEAWGNAAKCFIDRIYITQKRILRIMFKQPPLSPSQPLFAQLSILSIGKLYEYKILLVAHKEFYSIAEKTPSIYETRSSKINLPLPKSKTASGHRRIAYGSASLWNNLPPQIRADKNINKFKCSIRSHLLLK